VLVQDIPVEEAINRASEEFVPRLDNAIRLPYPATASNRLLERHRAKEFIRFLNHLEKEVPSDQDVHLIMNNDSTHKSAAVQPKSESVLLFC
jgi:hypothetical protein